MLKVNCLLLESNQWYEWEIPTLWSEVKWKYYVNFMNLPKDATTFEKVCALTDCPAEIISQLSQVQKDSFHDLYSIIPNPKDLDGCMGFADEYESFDIGAKAWGKLQVSLEAIAKTNTLNHYNVGSEIVKTYTGEDINDKYVSEVLGIVCFFLLKLIRSTNYSSLYSNGRKTPMQSLQELTGSRSSDTSQPSTGSQVETCSSMRKYSTPLPPLCI